MFMTTIEARHWHWHSHTHTHTLFGADSGTDTVSCSPTSQLAGGAHNHQSKGVDAAASKTPTVPQQSLTKSEHNWVIYANCHIHTHSHTRLDIHAQIQARKERAGANERRVWRKLPERWTAKFAQRTWLTNWQTNWLIDWLTAWLSEWPHGCLNDSPTE